MAMRKIGFAVPVSIRLLLPKHLLTTTVHSLHEQLSLAKKNVTSIVLKLAQFP